MNGLCKPLKLELPFPPSVNTYWGTRVISGKGKRGFVQRFVNHAGKKFRQVVLEELLVANVRVKFSGPLAATVELHPPCARRRDVDNYCKGLLDALAAGGIYDDDSQIRDLRVRMHPKSSSPRCEITLVPISDIQSEHSQLDLAG